MKIARLEIPDLIIFSPDIHADERGFFAEVFRKDAYNMFLDAHGFVQENISVSQPNVLRGLHYQVDYPQGKLLTVLSGEILDVAVDIREDSMFFGDWLSVHLTEDDCRWLWIPEGFAHGFYNIGNKPAKIMYKVTEYYDKSMERTILWNDKDLDIDWELKGTPIISEKDKGGTPFEKAEYL